MTPKGPLAIVALSGGVDSAVAALLLQQQGYRVQGLFMSNWEEDEAGYCTAADDYRDARRVCEVLDIPLHKVSFAAQYRERVFAHFLREYRAARTPNPDVLCNREIKFGICREYARRLGAEFFATGHYARLVRDGARHRLLKGCDTAKDQSYFLHSIDPAVLAQVLFPIGHLTKSVVRQIACDAVLPVYDKRDSTGICFIGERPFRTFLSQYLPAQPGAIETEGGEVIGRHQGLMYYTLGQRQGLGIGGRAHGEEAAWYVAGKDPLRNALIVVQGANHPRLFASALRTEPPHWISPLPDRGVLRCSVKTRYRQADQSCTVELDADGARVTFDTVQRAITPGQSAVFYLGEECLGGAVISTAFAGTPVRGFADALPAAMPI
ncbi:MAG TPA: tRNA 2-thiouridine(34) synthase MnmA [Steroidobacteraceae bacterium]|nr:tRNA 2-thiouridine(34) synthase MnmA [Steroidobacteraceae bacterium]